MTFPPPSPRSTKPSGVSIPYQPGLDGLRAVAVLVVMAYHGGVTGLRGGFLGVDIFFVLSGYLITTLLLVEYSRTQTIALIAFWARRARRLLPALGVVLIGILIYATLVAKPDRLDSIRDDALSSLTYVANWRFVFSNQSYFSQFSVPSPLRHMWSLAIEEQFYFIWPLVILLLLKLRVRLAPMTIIFGAAAVASTVLMAVLFSSSSDPSRVYYGTDTRAQALLIGATLATGLLYLRQRSEKQAPSAPWVRLGLLGAVVVALMLVFVRDTASWMYYGGYLLAALATAAVIAAAIQPRRNAIKSSLSPVWLRQIGKISYGLYLWHWPVFLTLTSGRIGVSGVVLLVIRFAVTFAIATTSFYVVELPIRQQHWRKGPRKAVLVTAMAAGALAGLFIFLPIVRPTSTPNKAVAIELTGTSPPPARILVVGDSVAQTVGQGFERGANDLGVDLFNRGQLACGLAEGGQLSRGGRWVDVEPTCTNWKNDWASYVKKLKPKVSLVLFDVFVISDLRLNDRDLAFGEPASDKYLTEQLSKGVDILRSDGGSVVLLTAPYNNRPERLGQPIEWTEDDPARVDHWNKLLRDYAKGLNDPQVTVVDINEYLSPKGKYTNSVSGTELRYDGVHFNPDAGEMLFGWLIPKLPASA